MSDEEWRPIAGHEGAYEVSSLGRVRSLARKVAHGRSMLTVAGRILKLYRHANGHMLVHLYASGRGTTAWVHRLVLEAFVGPAPLGTEGPFPPCRGRVEDDSLETNQAVAS